MLSRSLSRVFRNSNKNILTRNMSSVEKEVLGTDKSLEKLVYIDKTPYTVVTEGKAEVLFPSSHDVFYNPVQEFNRDLSIAILKQYAKVWNHLKPEKSKLNNLIEDKNSTKLKVLEALSASGLRSIRFAKEIAGLKEIIANDRDRQAFDSIVRNVKHNEVQDLVTPVNEDASLLMYQNRQSKTKFDVVDLDPYGTASPFLDAAVQCVSEGGLLMVTCTDVAILCGNGIEACHAKYGAVSIKIGSCHEMALRILLQAIESHANRYGKYIKPLLSLSVDFYVRVFVQIFTSPVIVKDSICKLSMVYVCSGCGSYFLQPIGNKSKTERGQKYSPGHGPSVNSICHICGCSFKLCGPIWSEKLHNKDFISKTVESVAEESEMYKTSKRMLGMLNIILEELDDCPLFHKIERLSSILHVTNPTNIQIRSALLNAGYKVSMSHCSPTSIKTDASPEVIWDIFRTWAKLHPGKKTYEIEPSKTIMSKESSTNVLFELHPNAEPESRSSHLLRFQINPTPNWGPKCRATTSLFKSKEKEKQLIKQNKRQKKMEANSIKKLKPENQENSCESH